MKKRILIAFLIAIIGPSFAQDETLVESCKKVHFATVDTVQREKGPIIYEGVFNVDFINGLYHYDNSNQYWFRVAENNIKAAFSVILEIELSDPENGVYEKMGDILCQEIHAPSTQKDVLNNGLYADAWGFNKNIEVWYNGDYIKLIYPALGNKTIKSDAHVFYVKSSDYEKIKKAFKPIK